MNIIYYFHILKSQNLSIKFRINNSPLNCLIIEFFLSSSFILLTLIINQHLIISNFNLSTFFIQSKRSCLKNKLKLLITYISSQIELFDIKDILLVLHKAGVRSHRALESFSRRC